MRREGEMSVAHEPGVTGLDDVLDRSVDLGVVTEEQARAIRALAAESPAAATPARTPGASRSRAAVGEVLGYLGGVLASVSAFLVASEYWPELADGVRVGLMAATTGGLVTAGLVLHDAVRPALARLGAFLWAVSAAAFAFTVVLAVRDVGGIHEDNALVTAAWATAAYAGAMWWRRRRGLQHATTFTALAAAIVLTMVVVDAGLASFAGLGLWALGLGWLMLALRDVLHPPGTGLVLGALAALVGPLTAGRWELLLGLATASCLVAVSIWLRHTTLLGLGVAGLFVSIPAAIFTFFGDDVGAPVAFFLVGVVLVTVSVVLAKLRSAV
jgi:hypothetical protein